MLGSSCFTRLGLLQRLEANLSGRGDLCSSGHRQLLHKIKDSTLSSYSTSVESRIVDWNNSDILVLYYGSSTCVASNRPYLPQVYSTIVDNMVQAFSSDSLNVLTVGVSRDWNASVGLEHLQRIYPFDEVYSGGYHHNAGIQHFIQDSGGGSGATPQVLLVMRQFDHTSGLRRTSTDRIFWRAVGTPQIKVLADTDNRILIDRYLNLE